MSSSSVEFSPREISSSPFVPPAILRVGQRIPLSDPTRIKPTEDRKRNKNVPSDWVIVDKSGDWYWKYVSNDCPSFTSNYAESSIEQEYEWYTSVRELQRRKTIQTDLIPQYVAWGKVLIDGFVSSDGMLLSDVRGMLLTEYPVSLPNSPDTALFPVASQLISTVSSLHQAGITHGDISHRNVLRTSSGICLIDPAPDRRGTPPFVHPELQTSGIDLFRADRYAVGILVLAMANATNNFHLRFAIKYLYEKTARGAKYLDSADITALPRIAGMINRDSFAGQYINCLREGNLAGLTEQLGQLRRSVRPNN